jgi:hypothetical protein
MTMIPRSQSRVMAFAVAALSLLMVVTNVDASIYDLHSVFGSELYVGKCSRMITEGEMFRDEDSPPGSTGSAFMRVEGSFNLPAVSDDEDDGTTKAANPGFVNVTIVFLHSVDALVSQSFYDSHVCVDGAPDFSALAAGHVTDTQVVAANPGKVTKFDAKRPVATSDMQAVMICPCSANFGAFESIEVEGTLAFKNPYGYLPATLYGFVPFNGIVTAMYFVLLLVFVLLCVRHREKLLGLQFAIVVVIVMGLLENASWFLTYYKMNTTGEPTCCPVRPDIVFIFALNDIKKTVSALLVLAVSLGFGVVSPRLSKGTTVKLMLLGGLYLFGTMSHDFERIVDINKAITENTPSYSALIVALCDVVFIFWINYGMNSISTELLETRQIAKLSMYQSLARVLYVFIVLFIVYTGIQMAVSSGKIHVPWSFNFLLWGFWDLMYFGVLVCIAYIWAPSETAAEYAYSKQLPTEDPDELGMDEAGLEMNAPDTANHFEIGDDDDDDMVDSEDEFERDIEMVTKA